MIQPIHKNSAFILVLQEHKRRLLFANIVFVKDYNIMAEMGKFERLDLGNDSMGIVFLPKDTEVQHEDRVVGVHGSKAMISTFVNVDYVVTVIHEMAELLSGFYVGRSKIQLIEQFPWITARSKPLSPASRRPLAEQQGQQGKPRNYPGAGADQVDYKRSQYQGATDDDTGIIPVIPA